MYCWQNGESNCPLNSHFAFRTQQTFFCLLWFLMLTKTLKLEYYVLDFSVWAHGPWMALAIVVSQNRSVRNITRLQPLKVVENNFWFSKNLLPFYRPENSRNIFFNVFSRSVTWHYTNRLRPRSCVTWHQAGWGGGRGQGGDWGGRGGGAGEGGRFSAHTLGTSQ